MIHPTPARLDADRLDALKRQAILRHHDFAAEMGLPEAALLEAGLRQGVLRIDATPGRLIPALGRLGEVMATTRNPACVIEKIGTYRDFQDGPRAVTGRDMAIDLRLDPRHWVHAFAVELDGLRSVQVFDAAGDAVHKIHLREASDLGAWEGLCRELALPEMTISADLAPRVAPEGALVDAAQTETLRTEWAALTGVSQLDPLARRLNMNRLGACRLAGPPHARPLPTGATEALFQAIRAQGIEVRLRIGNPGCMQIHTGPIRSLRPMGSLLNVIDARFSLHLRADLVAEVWLVNTPTPQGPALSVEAFDAQGVAVYKCCGLPKDQGGDPATWLRLVEGLPDMPGGQVVAR
ncbi:hemin-degrading factor [Paracoccus liaowanqingii]|uniref:Hemin-degrading factor n=1 Tax=Paracoccus liaowanqingii TaxID=2560053 RepID=A0A4P7HNC5_9RHOB|nr:ChuX/HutX family heme-like substrate-binding protein [Paracoccus liaowanqingii]QBX35756.1 hemin-degrading factor [Paracoccus liaowanqingii]